MSHLLKWNGLEVDPSKIKESTIVRPNILPESKALFQESKKEGDKPKILMPRIEAIHAGKTRNNTKYLADKLKGDPLLKSGIYSWTQPYPKPVIFNHDTDTEAVGRVVSASYSKETKAGREGIIVIPAITDSAAIEKILDGRLLTVSIGATTDSVVCNICGTDIIEEGFCGHWKGEQYDGETAEWIIGNVWFDELSWVNVPADQDAMVVDPGAVSVAEAYAHNGRELIDLGKQSTEWLVSQSKALSEGLVQKEKGDVSTLPNVEELQAQVTDLQAKLDEANSAKETAEAAVEAANQTIATKEAEVEALNTQVAEKQAELDAKTAESEAAKTSAEEEVAGLKTQVQELTSERDSLLSKNTELAAQIHKSTAERVVDLRVSLGKESDREAALAKFVERSTESLEDTLADLLIEASTATPQRVPGKVENPGSDNVPGPGQKEADGKDKKPSAEDALKSLFGGPAFQKRK